ncbi:MAG: PD40 domain-containing protein [Bacteroidales bacterium]|nr:PD40 domain-containing protein [Bacteroidales bacterium]MBN2764192.1 PD40 domain-containing protein [Bacteroidales bacterium]
MNKLSLSLFVYFLFLSVLFPPLPLHSQDEDANLKEIFLEAESYFLFEEFKDALPLYQRILHADPENYSINYKIGVCYLNDPYQKHKSIQYLEKAIQGTSPDYKQNNFKERNAPLEAFYYLGNAYRINNRLNEAVKAYNHFKQILDPVVYDEELVNTQIKACKIAEEFQSRPNHYIADNLGEPVNERYAEINPVISGNENVLMFTRKLPFYDAVFYAEKINGKWSDPVNLTAFFAVDGNSYCTGLSYDGREAFIYRLDGFDGNLYVSTFDGEKWSKLVKLNNNINTKYWESHASLSNDGKTLYFTSNRKEGYGGLDIYISERTRGGDWGPAKNLGPVVNSKYNEESPFVSEDGKTLFFSSLGHYNMGGYDIFYSDRLDNGQWTKPVNLGYPLNTTGDDIFFSPVKNGEYAYYSTYDASDSHGLTDIYKMEVFYDKHPRKFILNGIARIEDELKVDYGKILVSLVDRNTNTMVDQVAVNPNGSFTLNVTSGDFEMIFQGEGIQKTSENISIPVDNPSNIIAYTSPLIAPGLLSEKEPDLTPKPVDEKDLPTLISNFDSIEVITGEAVPIKLELERNSKLTIETYNNGILRKTEEFDINRKRFIYLFTPEPGENLLQLTLADEQGNINYRKIRVNYIPAAEELAEKQQDISQTKPADSFYKNLIGLSRGNLRKLLESTNPDSPGMTSVHDLYKYLISQAENHGYSIGEVDSLFVKILSGKDSDIFRDELHFIASGNIKSTLDTLDIKAENIYTPVDLLNLLYNSASENVFTRSDMRQLLTASISSGNDDVSRFISILREYSHDSLKRVLGQLDAANLGIHQPNDLIEYFVQQYPSLADYLDTALMHSAASLDLMFLHQSLIFISEDSLKNMVNKIRPEKENINTSEALIGYLWQKSATNGYSREELINTIDKIRKDPYSVVEMFRDLLSSRASGSLKTVIDELDIRAMHIDTFEDLLDYLIRQSDAHDYNRETVYSLLLDIINPLSLDDFLASLKKHAGENILNALSLLDVNVISTPFEVIRYLLSVSEEYGYTERDLLNLLLKLALEKGPAVADETVKSKGILHVFRKPGMVRNLIIVNSIIILIIIFLVFRKKSKKEER